MLWALRCFPSFSVSKSRLAWDPNRLHRRKLQAISSGRFYQKPLMERLGKAATAVVDEAAPALPKIDSQGVLQRVIANPGRLQCAAFHCVPCTHFCQDRGSEWALHIKANHIPNVSPTLLLSCLIECGSGTSSSTVNHNTAYRGPACPKAAGTGSKSSMSTTAAAESLWKFSALHCISTKSMGKVSRFKVDRKVTNTMTRSEAFGAYSWPVLRKSVLKQGENDDEYDDQEGQQPLPPNQSDADVSAPKYIPNEASRGQLRLESSMLSVVCNTTKMGGQEQGPQRDGVMMAIIIVTIAIIVVIVALIAGQSQ